MYQDQSTDFNNLKYHRCMYNNSILSGKVDKSIEDPVSQFFYDTSDRISKYLYNFGISPNHITGLRFILIIFAFFYFFRNRMYRVTAVLYILAYFGDCLDGHMARKYNLQTIEGDYMDHIFDILTMIISLYFMYNNLSDEKNDVMIVIGILIIASTFQISCQERYINKLNIDGASTSLGPLQNVCNDSIIPDENLKNFMGISKLFGAGTLHLFIFFVLWNFDYLEK